MYFLTALLELGGVGGDLTFVKAVSLILKSHQPTGAGRSLQLGSCWHFLPHAAQMGTVSRRTDGLLPFVSHPD